MGTLAEEAEEGARGAAGGLGGGGGQEFRQGLDRGGDVLGGQGAEAALGERLEGVQFGRDLGVGGPGEEGGEVEAVGFGDLGNGLRRVEEGGEEGAVERGGDGSGRFHTDTVPRGGAVCKVIVRFCF